MSVSAIKKAPRTAKDVHEAFANNLSYEDNIIWDIYTRAQFKVFRAKLEELFRNPPDTKKRKAMENIRETIYNSTISQSKYTNKNLLATYILVTVAKVDTCLQAENATEFSAHLIIRTRKCMKNDDTRGCCMVFIDESGRVYKNWKHFVQTNVLPEGIAFAPKNGIYMGDNTQQLLFEAWQTPASELGSKAANTADFAASVGGLAAAGVTLGALALPVAAPLVAGAGIVCVASGMYSALRSGWQLVERNDHEQSINVTDKQARGCWLGVASGALAATSAVATKTLSQAVIAGKEVSLIHQSVVNGMNISTMLLSGTGLANGILDLLLKHIDGEDVSGLDYLQVAASLAIFTHSVYNFRLASTIISQAQDSGLRSYRSELSNRQRKMFDKMSKETIRTRGATQGKSDLIRLINEVPDKQYLNDLNKINKDLNKNNVRFTAGRDGHILLNQDVSVEAGTLRNSVQHGMGENVLGKVSNPIPQSHQTMPNSEKVNQLTNIAFTADSHNLYQYCLNILNLAPTLILNNDTLQNCIQNLIEKIGEVVTQFLMTKAREFMQMFGRTVERYLKTSLYFEKVLWDLYKQCEQNLIAFTLESLEYEIQDMFASLLVYYKEMSCTNPAAQVFKCSDCNGSYEITPIE